MADIKTGMDIQGGRDSLKILEKAGNTGSSVHSVPNAGHHVYLDNPERTNAIIEEAIKNIPLFQGRNRANSVD